MTRSDVVSAAEALGSDILRARAETESLRQLPDSLVTRLGDAQLFRIALPETLGGPEVDPVSALDVYEVLATSEASVAWAVWNSSLPCLFSRYLEEDVRRELFGNREWKYASSTRPTGRASRANGGYRVSGRWSLVSGCQHSDLLGLMCLVEEDGEIEMLEHGGPHMRLVFALTDSVEILDTWHVGGLRGTGSHDVVIDALDVPEDRTFNPMSPSLADEPLAHVPIASLMSAGHAAICLGMARAGLQALEELAQSKVSPDPVPQLPDRASNQFLVARAATTIEALRAHLRTVVGVLWERAQAGSEVGIDEIADTWSAAVTTARECRSLVGAMYECAGSSALYTDFQLERIHRDIHAAMQHIIVQRFWLEDAGRVRFGMEPSNPLFML